MRKLFTYILLLFILQSCSQKIASNSVKAIPEAVELESNSTFDPVALNNSQFRQLQRTKRLQIKRLISQYSDSMRVLQTQAKESEKTARIQLKYYAKQYADSMSMLKTLIKHSEKSNRTQMRNLTKKSEDSISALKKLYKFQSKDHKIEKKYDFKKSKKSSLFWIIIALIELIVIIFLFKK